MNEGKACVKMRPVVLAATVAASFHAAAVTFVWDGSADNNWHNGANWATNVPPVPGSDALLGVGINDDVFLSADVEVDGLTVRDGTDLDTNGFRVDATDNAGTGSIEVGVGSRLTVDGPDNVVVPGALVVTDTFELAGRLLLDSSPFVNAHLRAVDTMTISSTGQIEAASGRLSFGPALVLPGPEPPPSVGLRNDGLIAGIGIDDALLVTASGNKTLDLDGFSGNGGVTVGVGQPFEIDFRAPLADPFSGGIVIEQRASIVTGPDWEIDGRVTFDGAADQAARLTVGPYDAPNQLDILAGGLLDVSFGDATLEGDINLAGRLEASDDTTVLLTGGEFRVVGGGQVDLGADNVTLILATDSVAELGQVSDLDGTAGNNTVKLRNFAELGVTGQPVDPFSGTFDAGGDNLLRLRDLRFDSGATVDFGFSGTTVLVDGTLRIDADVDLDGADNAAGDPHVYVLNQASERLEINGQIENDADAAAHAFDGTIRTAGTVDIDIPGTGAWRLDGTLELFREPLAPTNTAIVTGDAINIAGELRGRGTIQTDAAVIAGGTVRPGNEQSLGAEDAGTIDFMSTLTVQTGTVWMDVSGPDLTGSDVILVNALELGTSSVIRLSLIGDDLPELYTPTRLINASTLGGSLGVFGAVENVFVLLTNTALAVTYDATFNDVLVQRALNGDANLNQQVEQGDLDAVLQNWGKNNALGQPVSWVTGDLNGNGQVEQGDLDLVLQNWGSAATPDFRGLDVPEPAAVAGLAMIAGFSGRRRRDLDVAPTMYRR